MTIRAYVFDNWDDRHRLCLVRDAGRGKIEVLTDLVWKEYDEGDMIDQQSGIGQGDEIIQQIMNKGWDAGFRPAGFADVKNETDAIRSHLADMKVIAFHQLKIKGA